jgi:hypothetical protein
MRSSRSFSACSPPPLCDVQHVADTAFVLACWVWCYDETSQKVDHEEAVADALSALHVLRFKTESSFYARTALRSHLVRRCVASIYNLAFAGALAVVTFASTAATYGDRSRSG